MVACAPFHNKGHLIFQVNLWPQMDKQSHLQLSEGNHPYNRYSFLCILKKNYELKLLSSHRGPKTKPYPRAFSTLLSMSPLLFLVDSESWCCEVGGSKTRHCRGGVFGCWFQSNLSPYHNGHI